MEDMLHFLECIQVKPKCQTVVGKAHLSIFSHLVSVELLLNISVIQKFFKCKETFEVYVGGLKKIPGCGTEGSWFAPQSGQNMEWVLVVGDGTRTPSEHCGVDLTLHPNSAGIDSSSLLQHLKYPVKFWFYYTN